MELIWSNLYLKRKKSYGTVLAGAFYPGLAPMNNWAISGLQEYLVFEALVSPALAGWAIPVHHGQLQSLVGLTAKIIISIYLSNCPFTPTIDWN